MRSSVCMIWSSVLLIIWSEVFCALVVRFRPTSRVEHKVYRERPIGVLRTNERSLTETV